ncbi:hypothetical protein NE237_019140 [Protea cynaroides]|uniref:Uncharacterized protein n=1 Tax=Protea cynaroides TaxID=273540 RepID=A0A9Q0KBG0_9MAGN|nr:hypothetical protein NE237_019140 [Protea cynaroides]
MTFHTLYRPSLLAINLNKHKTQYKIRPLPAQAVQPSVVLLHFDESSKNSLESKKSSGSDLAPTSSQRTSPLLSQVNTVGIIGGVSAVSTLNFLEKLISWNSKDGEENLSFIVCSDPTLNIELLSCERGSYLNGTDARSQLKFGFEPCLMHTSIVMLLDKDTMKHIVTPAIEALSRKDLEGARNLLRIALQVLLVWSVNLAILASDDMHGLLPKDDPLLKKCVDPIDALARSTIKWAQSTRKLHETS